MGLFQTVWEFLTTLNPKKVEEEEKENIAVLCAGNLIMICLLIGILVLQVGQAWVREYIVKPELERQKQALREKRNEGKNKDVPTEVVKEKRDGLVKRK
jgi:hypothetical protein